MTETTKIYHKCPNCGFMIPDFNFKYGMWDYLCPRCEKTHLSSFEVVKEND